MKSHSPSSPDPDSADSHAGAYATFSLIDVSNTPLCESTVKEKKYRTRKVIQIVLFENHPLISSLQKNVHG